MADYAGTTWVDDDGSGTTGTVGTAARLNNMEAGILDAATHNRIGAFATMPAAAAANKNWLWIATNTDGTGGLYRSDGVAWVKMPVGSLAAATLFGTGGGLWSLSSSNSRLTTNYNSTTDRLIDTTLAGWMVSLGDGADVFRIYRAAPTAVSPTWAVYATLDSTTLLKLAGNVRFGTAGQFGSLTADAGGFGFNTNIDPATGFQLDGAKPSWRVLNFYAGGSNDFWKVQRAPATGSTAITPTFVDFFSTNSAANFTALGFVLFGSGGMIRSPGQDNTALYSNYNATTDRLFNTGQSAYRLILGNGADQIIVQRAPATTVSPVFTTILEIKNDGSMVGGNPPWVTALPTTGPGGGALRDGQECHFLADATTGTVWHLKYRAAEAGAFKWYVVGGSPLLSVIDTADQTASTTYVDLTTVGPSVTVPLAGDYEQEISATVNSLSGANRLFVSPKKNATAAADLDSAEASSPGGSTGTATAYRRRKLTGLAAGDVFKLQYSNLNATNASYGYRSIQMTPIRVG